MTHPPRKLSAAITLFFVAPLVAEFLLGNLSIRMLPALVALAPMYGGGALLIREAIRRAGRGWPGILLLGAAYTLIEEGFVTQSLFNPDYLRMHMHLLVPAYIAALHMGAWWTLFMFNLHTFWSISVSIALVEGLYPARAETPWLGALGDSIVALLFLVGCGVCGAMTVHQDPFIASPQQWTGAGLVCLLLITLAVRTVPRAPRNRTGSVPSTWIMGLLAAVLGFGVLMIPTHWGWGAFAVMLAIDGAFLLVVRLFSRRRNWTAVHTLSLGAGGALAYGIHAFIEQPVVGGAGLLARVGNGVFLTAAIALIAVGVQRTATATRRSEQPVSS